MDKQQDIRSKKEPEVSSLKKSDSNIISEPHYRYVTPIKDSNQKNLPHQSPDPPITIPIQCRERDNMQPKILAIKIQNSSYNIKPKPNSQENVLVLSKSIQRTSNDYDTSKLLLQLFLFRTYVYFWPFHDSFYDSFWLDRLGSGSKSIWLTSIMTHPFSIYMLSTTFVTLAKI